RGGFRRALGPLRARSRSLAGAHLRRLVVGSVARLTPPCRRRGGRRLGERGALRERLGRDDRHTRALARPRPRARAPARGVRRVPPPRRAPGVARGRRRQRDRRDPSLRERRHAGRLAGRRVREASADSLRAMSRLRARCPDCRTNTAVAIGPEYECHACGRSFGAGLVRVPRAWGHTLDSGAGMVAAATELALPYPDAAVVAEDTLVDQVLVLASELP